MKSWIRVLIGLCLLLIVLPVSAQTDLSQAVDLGDGYSISIPADWKATPKQSYMVLENPDLVFFVLTPPVIDSVGMKITTRSTHADLVINFSVLIEALGSSGNPPDADNIEEAVFNRRKALTYIDTSASADQEHILLYMSDNRLGYLIVMARKGQLQDSNELINTIVASFDHAESAASATQSTQIDCVVSTNGAILIPFHASPDPDSTPFGFLIPEVTVTVTDRRVLNNGDVWYQLDKAEAAPDGIDASELWVEADQVNADGDCEHIGETNAQPTESSDDQTDASSTPEVGSLPSEGRWTFTLSDVSHLSCDGGDKVLIESNKVYASLTHTFSLAASDANSFQFGDGDFSRQPETNSFTGSFTFDELLKADLTFDLQSPTSMEGQMVASPGGGTSCTVTTAFQTTDR